MDIPANIAQRLTRPAAVFGAGVSGMAAAKLLAHAGVNAVLYDEKGTNGALRIFNEETATAHDLVIYSPGFPHNHPWLLTARAANAVCIGETDFAFLFWKGPLVAVTGTNGKTTLTEFLVFAHKRCGREAVAAGNIGFPLSSVLDIAGSRAPLPVCEVSSFQAEDMRHFAPSALLWTNFATDHLDRHGNLENYFRAKYKLVNRLASQRLIVGESVMAAAARFKIEMPAFTEVATRAEVAGQLPENSPLALHPQLENYAIARRYWLAEGYPERALLDAARVFKAGRHRLAKLAEIANVSYWDDSKATNFHATLAALDSFNAPIHWIGGGRAKGGNAHAFARAVATRIASADLIGETAPALLDDFQAQGIPVRVHARLADAVFAASATANEAAAAAAEAAETAAAEAANAANSVFPGTFGNAFGTAPAAASEATPATSRVVLLSPGFASFDMFKNYAERGLAFEQAVLVLKAKAAYHPTPHR